VDEQKGKGKKRKRPDTVQQPTQMSTLIKEAKKNAAMLSIGRREGGAGSRMKCRTPRCHPPSFIPEEIVPDFSKFRYLV